MVKKRRAKRTPAWLRSVKESGLVYGLGALLIIGATWFTFQFIEPAPPRSLSIATGSAAGAYRAFAEELQTQLAKEDVTLEIFETDDSVDNLQRLANGDVDVAFLQSGLSNEAEYPQLESLGVMYVEPVWVFLRDDLSIERLSDLKGLRIGTGGAGSGSRTVAKSLLDSNGLSDIDVELTNDSGLEAVASLQNGDLDALVSVASISAPMIVALLDTPEARLLSLDRAPAYARREPWLNHLTLPEGVVDLAMNIPETDIELLAVNATLVSSDSLHPALRDLLLQAADEVFSVATLLSGTDEYPQAAGGDFAVSDAAQRYYDFGPPFLQRYLPFWIANLVDRLKLLALPLLALLLPLSRLLPPAYRWSVRKKIYRWYDEVQSIDLEASDDESQQNLEAYKARLELIENEVREVEVPLSYAHELYVLRQHIELLIKQIDQSIQGK